MKKSEQSALHLALACLVVLVMACATCSERHIAPSTSSAHDGR